MVMKLNPPQIESSLLPIIENEVDSGSEKIKVYTITIPLYSNPSVGINEIGGLSVVIKTVSTGLQKEALQYKFTQEEIDSMYFGKKLIITLDKDYSVGQYYKVQCAYLDRSSDYNVGYYSSVGVTKCTAEAQVSISGFNTGVTNNSLSEYVGVYETIDPTEKVYSYCFTITNEDGVYETSGELLHNTNNDVSNTTSKNTWTPIKMLQDHKKYNITYEVTTVNNLRIKSPSYRIDMGQDGYFDHEGTFIATLNNEEGYVDLHFKHLINKSVILNAGDYIITRSSSKDNFKDWIKLTTIIVHNDIENPHFYKDYAIEQGVSYRYGIQLIKSNKWLTARRLAYHFHNPSDEAYHTNASKSILVDFENAYLFDGECQLCIKYNPKVASFKSTMLESKVDTLGGKYPFVFRNGDVNYKEFSISGLISILMDENSGFLPAAANDQESRSRTPGYAEWSSNFSTNLTGDNFYKERDFKLKVLEWLTNGQPKLFRSPGEGNYIIRLMNTSLSPNDTLGRMLHTFTSTAYEIADYNILNMYKYGFIKEEINLSVEPTIIFNEVIVAATGGYFSKASYLNGEVQYLRFDNQYSDCNIAVYFKNSTTGNNGPDAIFNIGNSSGTYILSQLKDNPIVQIEVLDTNAVNKATKMTWGYYKSANNLTHNNTSKPRERQVVVKQFYLKNDNILQDLTNSQKNEVINYCYLIKLMPKPIVDIAENNDQQWVYAMRDGGSIIYSQVQPEWHPCVLYRDLGGDGLLYSFDGNSLIKIEDVINYDFNLNGGVASLTPTVFNEVIQQQLLLLSKEPYTLVDAFGTQLSSTEQQMVIENSLKICARFTAIKDIGELKSLSIGNGIFCEVVYEVCGDKPGEQP